MTIETEIEIGSVSNDPRNMRSNNGKRAIWSWTEVDSRLENEQSEAMHIPRRRWERAPEGTAEELFVKVMSNKEIHEFL
jgi:hypothetical protein